MKRKVTIAGENHQANLLALCNDLIVGLKIELHFIELTRLKRLAFANRSIVLWIGPPASDDVVGDLGPIAISPWQ